MTTKHVTHGETVAGGLVKGITLAKELEAIPGTTPTRVRTLTRLAVQDGEVEDIKCSDIGQARYYTPADADKLRERIRSDVANRSDADKARIQATRERFERNVLRRVPKKASPVEKPKTGAEDDANEPDGTQAREDANLTAVEILRGPGPQSTRKSPTARRKKLVDEDEDGEPDSGSDKKRGAWTWVLLVGALAVGGFLFMAWRKKRQQQAQATPTAPQPQPVQPTPQPVQPQRANQMFEDVSSDQLAAEYERRLRQQ
jgi:hypothetical protein